MVWLRNRELSHSAESSPLVISPEYVRGSYKWLQDHENKIENSHSGTRGLEFYELFSVDGARKGTQPRLCAPWFQHYTTDDLCSVPIHTMAADFKQQYKQLPCVVSYLQKEVRCNSSHPDLGCVCGTASCFAPNLWLEGKDKPGREKLSVAHAMLDVSIINNKRGIFERRYLYLPVARCYEFIGNKLHFETNLDLGPQDKPLLVFLPKSDGSGWVTQELAGWGYQRTQYGIYEHMARHLKRMGLDLFPAVPGAAAAPEPAAAAAATTAPLAAAAATGEDGGRKAAHREKPSAAVAGRAVSTGRAAARAAAAAGDRAQEATPASKLARLSTASSPAARAAAAAAAGAGGSRPNHKGPVATAASAGSSRPLKSRALLPVAVPEAGVIAAAKGEATKPASPTATPAPLAAAVVAAMAAAARDAARPSSQVHAQAAPAPAAAAAATKFEPAAAVVSAENTTKPAECAAGPAAAAAAMTAAASWISNSGWSAKQPAGPTAKLAKIQTQPTDTTSSESGVLTCAADAAAAAATMARQMASSSEPTDCWAALSAMLQPTLAAQETIFSSAQHTRRQDRALAEGSRMVCT